MSRSVTSLDERRAERALDRDGRYRLRVAAPSARVLIRSLEAALARAERPTSNDPLAEDAENARDLKAANHIAVVIEVLDLVGGAEMILGTEP